MKPVVVIPFRGVDEDRRLNLKTILRTYENLELPVFLGDHEGEFTSAIAKNVAATEAIAAIDPDVLFVTDSDLMIRNHRQVTTACRIAVEQDCYVIAYDRLVYLGERGTLRAREGRPPTRKDMDNAVSKTWGGAFAISRTLWERVGGYDPRFVGYGHDDIAFTPCANTMGGTWKERVFGYCYHLNHPESDKSNHQGWNAALASRYRALDGDRDGMARLLAERCR